VIGDDYDFHDVRDWCWQTWGASKELDEWLLYDRNHPSWRFANEELTNCQNPYWCWVNDDHRRRIMLTGPEEVALFKLRFGV
jgi:hypothetical protein